MASLRRKGKVYYVRFRTDDGRQTERKVGPDKSVALKIKRDLETKLVNVKLGLETSQADGERIPISQHVESYVANLEARGRVLEHTRLVRQRLEWFLAETKITRLSQLRPALADQALSTLRKAGKSDQTVSHYATSLKSFTEWLRKNHWTKTDLLADLDRPAIVTTRERSAMTSSQLAALIETTRSRGLARRGLSGLDRSWLYSLATYTGLRRRELWALTPESFDLDSEPALVSLPGAATKNRKRADQPLPGHLVADLKEWLASKAGGVPIFGPMLHNTSPLIKADLRLAGVDSEQFDFHSLRHSYLTLVDACGPSSKEAMTLGRHSTPQLTPGRYTHSRLENLGRVVDRMPNLLSHTSTTPVVSSGRNGATSGSMEPSPGPSLERMDHRLEGRISCTRKPQPSTLPRP